MCRFLDVRLLSWHYDGSQTKARDPESGAVLNDGEAVTTTTTGNVDRENEWAIVRASQTI